jgi:hypothetical protein
MQYLQWFVRDMVLSPQGDAARGAYTLRVRYPRAYDAAVRACAQCCDTVMPCRVRTACIVWITGSRDQIIILFRTAAGRWAQRDTVHVAYVRVRYASTVCAVRNPEPRARACSTIRDAVRGCVSGYGDRNHRIRPLARAVRTHCCTRCVRAVRAYAYDTHYVMRRHVHVQYTVQRVLRVYITQPVRGSAGS